MFKLLMPIRINHWIKQMEIKTLCGFLLILLCAACANPKKIIFDENLPSGQSVYRDAMAGVGRGDDSSGNKLGQQRYGYSNGSNIKPYTRVASNQMEQLFPTVYNPIIELYVYPHLNQDELPIPGYTTAFPLYEKAVIFALPGEL